MVDVRPYTNNPLRFFDDLIIPSVHGPRKFSTCMAPFQRETFQAIAPSLLAVAKGKKPPCGRYWMERTKGGSKDSDAAAMIVFLLFFSPRSLVVQCGASDQGQADEARKCIKALTTLNPWLNERLTVQGFRVVQNETGSVCDILAADATGGSHGSRPDVVLLNEVSHISKIEFAQTLLDNAGKIPNSLVICASNAGHCGTWQHELRELARTSDRWTFHALSEPAPWIDADELREAERRNPRGRFLRLWHGVWHDQAESAALDTTDITRCVRLAGELQPERGFAYCGGVDLGIAHDAAAIIVCAKSTAWVETIPQPRAAVSRLAEVLVDVGEIEPPDDEPSYTTHPGDGRLRVAAIRCWRPRPGKRVDLDSVERELAALHERYGFSRVGADPWQAEHMVQNLQRRGVPIETVSFSSADNQQSMASTLLDSIRENAIDLPGDADLLADLKALRLLDKGLRFRLIASRTNGDGAGTPHGDLGIALSIATHVAKSIRTSESRVAYGGAPLVCWP